MTTMTPDSKALVFVGVLAVALIYFFWMVYYIGRMNARHGRKEADQKSEKVKGDIIGKSLFVLPQSHSQPQAAVESETEPTEQITDIFAPESVPQHPRQIPPDELDEVFGEAPEGEPNEPLEITAPLFVEHFPDDDADDEDWMNEPDEQYDDDYPLTRAKTYAQGVSFQQMSDAYRSVVQDNPLTDEQKEETGRILLNMKGNDIYNHLSGQPERANKVKTLINTFLSAYEKSEVDRSAEGPSPQSDSPSGFDVRDFV